MAAEADHIALANKNHEALLYLMIDPEKFPEWITTVAFYKAVQIVEAVFSHHPSTKNCSSHPERLNQLKRPEFVPIFRHFRVLYSASTIARYLHDNANHDSYSRFTDYLPAEKVIRKIIEKRLRPIEENCIRLLSSSAKQSLSRISSGSL